MALLFPLSVNSPQQLRNQRLVQTHLAYTRDIIAPYPSPCSSNSLKRWLQMRWNVPIAGQTQCRLVKPMLNFAPAGQSFNGRSKSRQLTNVIAAGEGGHGRIIIRTGRRGKPLGLGIWRTGGDHKPQP